GGEDRWGRALGGGGQVASQAGGLPRRLVCGGGVRRARGVAPGGPPARTGVGEPHGTSAGVATGPSPRRAGASVERAASGDRVGSERPRSRRRPAAARTQIPITHARRVTSPARARGRIGPVRA